MRLKEVLVTKICFKELPPLGAAIKITRTHKKDDDWVIQAFVVSHRGWNPKSGSSSSAYLSDGTYIRKEGKDWLWFNGNCEKGGCQIEPISILRIFLSLVFFSVKGGKK